MRPVTVHLADGIARVVIDLAGEKVNKFSAAVVAELGELVRSLQERRPRLKRGGLHQRQAPGCSSPAPTSASCRRIGARAEALAKAEAGQRLFQRIADLPVPTMAVIDGACLGGGLEFALACTYRIVADEEKTRARACPRSPSGIIPGLGRAPMRLPRPDRHCARRSR